MHDRKLVYDAVDSERDYQDHLPSTRTDGKTKSVGDYITLLQYYQTQLTEDWVKNPGDKAALDSMRKIAGIAVRCMEEHGAPKRFDVESLVGSRGRPESN